jgi:hypothetical protein
MLKVCQQKPGCSLSSTLRRISMLILETPGSRSFALEGSLTPVPASIGSVAKDSRKKVAYIEPPPLFPTERAKYEPVSNRDLPQDFDYSLPLSDRVIIGEYRDDTTLWYYVENAAGIAHRVSMPSIVFILVPVMSPLFKFTSQYQFEASTFAKAFPYSVYEYSE